ncbi:MAG TPA: hypothetical protein VKU85_06815, partial [bacterium]|nr:hypothetical protein [bacterium]
MPRPYRSGILLGSALALTLAVSPAAHATAAAVRLDTFHQDHRSTPKLQFEPAWDGAGGATGEVLARGFLVETADRYGLADPQDLRLARVRESLLGTHYVFQQQIQGIDVHGAEVIVSVAREDGRVYRVFNNSFPVKDAPALDRAAALDREAALDAAWNRLRVHGEITAEPDARLVWAPEGDGFRLTWIVTLEVTEPFGAWEVRLDAASGRVLETTDTSHYRKVDELTSAPLAERIDSYAGPVADRRETVARFTQRREARAALRQGAMLANGTGVVFDPDPRATLMDDNLQDGSAPAAFTGSYFTRNLLDITFAGGLYRLTGPWIDIIDFESPATAP